MDSTSRVEPQVGCSTDQACGLESDTIEESRNFEVRRYENNQVNKPEMSETAANTKSSNTKVITVAPQQHFVIAENVIIEELAEDESAEADMMIDDPSLNKQVTKKKKTAKKRVQSSVMDKWSDLEKQQFLKSITEFGIIDTDQIAKSIPSKTIDEVNEASEHYWQLAQSRMASTAREFAMQKARKMPRPRREGNPLSEWLHVLNESLGVEELRTVTGDALRLIADCEYFPAPAEVTNVQFQKLYYALADAIEGRPVPELSDESYEILRRALTQVSLSTVHLGKNGFDDHLRSLTSLRSHLVSRTDEPKMCVLKHRLASLIVKKPYNPLNVPLKLLDLLNTADGSLQNSNIDRKQNEI